jgi:hypothetical protein
VDFMTDHRGCDRCVLEGQRIGAMKLQRLHTHLFAFRVRDVRM